MAASWASVGYLSSMLNPSHLGVFLNASLRVAILRGSIISVDFAKKDEGGWAVGHHDINVVSSLTDLGGQRNATNFS